MKHMKKVALPVDMINLPGDVLSNILFRLLAKQLARLRCVCKSWNAFLSESSFIKSHLHHSIHNKRDILLLFQKNVSYHCLISPGPITARHSDSPRVELTNFIKELKFPTNPQHKIPLVDVVGSMNGLICFAYESDRKYFIRIWNPSLSAVVTLPPSSLSGNGYHLGFGYDPKTDDYKVVNLAAFYKKPKNVTQPQGEVYSMRKGSWEIISQRIPSHIRNFIHQNEVCVNGHLHWICAIDLEVCPRPQTIVVYDLGAMTFGEIHLPDSILLLPDPRGHRVNVLGVLSGKLCLMSHVRDGECDVWVMNGDKSWVKNHVFSHFSSRISPYGFTSHEEFFFQVDYDGRFALYDPIGAKTKTFKIEMIRRLDSFIIFEYVDSLVWIAPVGQLNN